MPSRRDRPTFFDRFSSLPGMLVTAGVIEVGIVILFEQSRYGPWLSHLSLHILTILISTGISLFLTLPRLKREQQVLESVIAERTKALRQVNAQLEQEIEDRKQVEAALRQRETTLKKVQQIAKIGSWEFNLQNRQTIWSEELYRMHGLDPHQPPPTPEEVFMLTHPDDRPIHQQQIVEPVYRGQAFAADIRIVAQDGTLRYVEARGEPILDERLQLIGYIGITHDLTERRITEDKLRQSEATNRALVQSIPDLLIRIHRDATWLDVVYGSNVKLFGLSQSQIERHIQELLPLGSAAELMKTIRQVLHTQQIQVKERSVLFNQKRFYGETRIMPCAEDEVLVIFRDVSDRKQAELELKDAKESAESANRAKSAFISSMSHELRTPLNAIMGFAQLLNRDKSISPQQQHYINTINRSGQHLLELINDVLEVSKIEAGKTVLNTSSFDLYQLLNTLEELFRPKAIAKKLILTIERSRTTPLYIHTDEHKLRQVLINLLGNAVKFTHTGRITLRVQELDPVDCPPLTPMSQMLYFEIQDTGVGIASADLPKLFKPFSQTQSGREAGEGTGLGLVISRHFVELMGGELGVYNTLGEGSTFWFTIQVQFVSCDLLPTPIQTQRVIGLEPHQPTYRILIVEDQAENAEFLQQLLTSVGFETMQARQGQEGISLWKIWQPHLILMDMQMPVMDGYTTSRLIKSTPEGQRTKIIAVTGSAFEEDRDRILAIGCDDFIRKPVSESLLFAKIAQHLGARFCYEAVELDGETAVQGQLWPLSQDALHVMPIDWVTALNQAARECHEPAVFQLLQQIPTEHETLAIALKQLAIDFRFEEMANLTNGAGR